GAVARRRQRGARCLRSRRPLAREGRAHAGVVRPARRMGARRQRARAAGGEVKRAADDADKRLREAAESLLAFLNSDEGVALRRLGEILDAARTDPAIVKSTHIKGLVEYLADVAEHRWRELLHGDDVDALREVANERN